MMGASGRIALLHQVRFAVLHGLPLETMAPDIFAGRSAKRRFIEKLRAGESLQAALPALGFRGRTAALVSIAESGADPAEALDLAQTSLSLGMDFSAGVLHALFYPCLLMMLSLLSWGYLKFLGILQPGDFSGFILLPAAFLLCLCAVFLLPRALALKAGWTRSAWLLVDAHLLFGFLDLLIRGGGYTARLFSKQIRDLHLKEAAGEEALRDLTEGRPLSWVLSRMPAARLIAGITPREENIRDFIRVMRDQALDLHRRKARRLFVLLHVTGLLTAGAAIALLSAGVYMNLYGKGLPW